MKSILHEPTSDIGAYLSANGLTLRTILVNRDVLGVRLIQPLPRAPDPRPTRLSADQVSIISLF